VKRRQLRVLRRLLLAELFDHRCLCSPMPTEHR
jgi:hypothetical protein